MSCCLYLFKLKKGENFCAVSLWLKRAVVWSKHREIWKPYCHVLLSSRDSAFLCRSRPSESAYMMTRDRLHVSGADHQCDHERPALQILLRPRLYIPTDTVNRKDTTPTLQVTPPTLTSHFQPSITVTSPR